jgi:alkylation response protein AidB-like acyl-CoA dehydrogenase
VVLARDSDEGGYWLALVDPADPGVEIQPYNSFDNERIAGVRLRGVEIGPDRLAAPARLTEEEVEEAYALTRLLRCAELVGGAQRVLDITVDHVKVRRQFGVPIGSFQAVQHQLADLAIAVDVARLATYEGLSEAGQGASCLKSSALSVHLCARASVQAAIDGAQFHGGIGCIRDHRMNLYYRRAKAMQLRLGSTAQQRANLARTHLPAT